MYLYHRYAKTTKLIKLKFCINVVNVSQKWYGFSKVLYFTKYVEIVSSILVQHDNEWG